MARAIRVFFVIVGMLSVAVGALGVLLPILPTTPFLLLALFCFARGSDRWNNWLVGTTLYRNYLESFLERRALTVKQKLGILLFADAMIAFPLILIESIIVKLILALLIIIKYCYFIFAIKTI